MSDHDAAPVTNDVKRRDFLKVVGVAGAGAGLTACSTGEAEKLIPYVVPPEDVTPGVATWYTSVCGECPAGCGIWARTREGRVVKLEGNPAHPISQGALCHRGHSSLQGLYNPDRYAGPMLRENGELRDASWEEAEDLLAQRIRGAAGNILLVTGTAGPTLSDVFDSFVTSVGGARVRYDAFSQAPLREAARIAFGREVVPHYDFESARFIVSFGADFLETWLSPVEYGRGFARATGVDDMASKARFVSVTPHLSLTGLNADEWVPIKPGAEAAVALAMANLIAGDGGVAAGPYGAMLRDFDAAAAARTAGVDASAIETLAERFMAEGPSLALGPGIGGQHRNATAAHVAALVLNQVAGNVGRTVQLQNGWIGQSDRSYSEMQTAIQSMAAGGVGVAMVHGANPAYSLPPASGFVEAFGGVPFKVAFGSAPDETTALADLVLPDHHYLEAWGDSNPRPGMYAIQQPVMRPVPLFDSKHTGDVLLSVASRLGEPLPSPTFYEHLRTRWRQLQGPAGGGGDFDAFWRGALRAGTVATGLPSDGSAASGAAAGAAPGQGDGATPRPARGTALPGGAPAGQEGTLRSPDRPLSFDAPEIDGEGLEFTLIVYPSSRLGDGRFANRPWLQELPDPVTKVTWDSWIEVNPATCERLGLVKGDVVRVTSPHGELSVAVWPYPGVREDVVAMTTGGGHTDMGRYADGWGVNPMGLLPAVVEAASGAMVQMATRVSLEATGVRHRFADIEGSATQQNRPIAPAVALASLAGTTPGREAAGRTVPGEEVHDEAAESEGAGADEEHAEAEPGHAAAAEHASEGGHGPLKELQGGGGFLPRETEGVPTSFPLAGTRYGAYENWEETPRWAMAVDLDKCTGCSACVVACQAENNVPWVGQEMVQMGREMHWIRLERYYEQIDATRAGPLDVRFLPMLCQQCGNAPCEPVCPVFAAYHTPDGINAQVYNRCVGTRYCANNCPYKVRVFNWYTYTDVPEPLNWQYNPDVTVRENGVMEKCTFCVQRIREAQNHAAVEGRALATDDIVPACQQTCPAEAITFGNARDAESTVSQAIGDERTYRVLDDFINTQPAVNYLKKVTFHAVETAEH